MYRDRNVSLYFFIYKGKSVVDYSLLGTVGSGHAFQQTAAKGIPMSSRGSGISTKTPWGSYLPLPPKTRVTDKVTPIHLADVGIYRFFFLTRGNSL